MHGTVSGGAPQHLHFSITLYLLCLTMSCFCSSSFTESNSWTSLILSSITFCALWASTQMQFSYYSLLSAYLQECIKYEYILCTLLYLYIYMGDRLKAWLIHTAEFTQLASWWVSMYTLHIHSLNTLEIILTHYCYTLYTTLRYLQPRRSYGRMQLRCHELHSTLSIMKSSSMKNQL